MTNFKTSDRIRRASHSKNYTVIHNDAIQDSELSWKARGLHHYILSLPDDWEICIAHLAEQSEKDGIDSVKAALKELQDKSYLFKSRVKDDRGRFLKCVWDVYELPQVDFPHMEELNTSKGSSRSPKVDFPQVDKPQVGRPQVDKPQVENPTLISTYIQSTDLTSTNLKSTNLEKENINRAPEKKADPQKANFSEPQDQNLPSPENAKNEFPLQKTNFALDHFSAAAEIQNFENSDISQAINLLIKIWQADAPAHWIPTLTVDGETAKALMLFVREFQGDSLEIFQNGLFYAATDKWCMKAENRLNLKRYLYQNRPFDYAEKWRSRQDGGNTGNTVEDYLEALEGL